MSTNPPKKTRKTQIKLTEKLKTFIVDKICEGLNLAEICRRFSSSLPGYSAVLKAEQRDPVFHENVTKAYEMLFRQRQDELDDLSNRSAIEIYPHLDFKEASETARRRQDALKFMLAKLAPLISDRYKLATKVEHSGSIEGNQVQIVSYALPDVEVIKGDSKESDKVSH